MKELVLSIPKGKYIKTKVDTDELKLYDYLIQIYCVIENKYLPVAERILLTYYTKYGLNTETEEKYIEDFKRSKQIVSNLKYQLTQRGFLTKNENSNAHELPAFLKQRREDLTIIVELYARK